MVEEEGTNFVAAVVGKFATKERTLERLALERKANATPAQRRRRGPAKVQVNFRASAETKRAIDALMEHLDAGQTDVIERAIAHFASATLKGRG